jgi:RNA polymerase sigma factor (sigma-70 family)
VDQDQDILKACLNGDRNAQKQLYLRHKDRLFAVCLRYANSREEAEDVLQEGYIKVYRDLKQYKPIAPLYVWMRTVIVRTALEHIRKRSRRPQSQGVINDRTDLGKPEQSSGKLAAEELLTLIQQLPVDMRHCFNLHAIDGYSHREIAEMLDISEANSKMRVSRARSILKKQVEKLFEVH